MKKIKGYAVGGGLEESLGNPYASEKKRKPLPSETITEDKSVSEKAVDLVKGLGKRLKENVLGTEEQNRMAEEREIERARKNPEGNEAKFRKAMGKPFKSGGSVSASKRADGCATKGKTRGRIV